MDSIWTNGSWQVVTTSNDFLFHYFILSISLSLVRSYSSNGTQFISVSSIIDKVQRKGGPFTMKAKNKRYRLYWTTPNKLWHQSWSANECPVVLKLVLTATSFLVSKLLALHKIIQISHSGKEFIIRNSYVYNLLAPRKSLLCRVLGPLFLYLNFLFFLSPTDKEWSPTAKGMTGQLDYMREWMRESNGLGSHSFLLWWNIHPVQLVLIDDPLTK